MNLNNFYTIADAVHGEEETSGLAEKAKSIALQFGVDTPLLTAQVICFLMLAYILWNYGFKKILGTMEEREKKISDGLRYAEEVKIKLEDAERKHTDTLKEASEEAKKTLASAREQAKNFEEQLRKDAEIRAEDIVRKAGEQMELERQTMVAETKMEFAKLV